MVNKLKRMCLTWGHNFNCERIQWWKKVTWEKVNFDRIFIFSQTVPLITTRQLWLIFKHCIIPRGELKKSIFNIFNTFQSKVLNNFLNLAIKTTKNKIYIFLFLITNFWQNKEKWHLHLCFDKVGWSCLEGKQCQEVANLWSELSKDMSVSVLCA